MTQQNTFLEFSDCAVLRIDEVWHNSRETPFRVIAIDERANIAHLVNLITNRTAQASFNPQPANWSRKSAAPPR